MVGTQSKLGKRSPSTRRAWIEIVSAVLGNMEWEVALHPEGVDRNINLSEPVRE